MSTTLASVTKAVYSYFKAVTTSGSVYAAVTGRMYNTIAPDNATLPYIVFSIIEIEPSYYFGSLNIEEAKVRFTIVDSAKYDATTIMTIADKLRTRFDEANSITFSDSDYSTMKFIPISLGGVEALDDRLECVSEYLFQYSTV